MATDSGLRVGPQDFDAAGGLAADLGTHNKAHKVIQQVAAMYPAELVTAHIRTADQDRTETLDEEEVVSAAESDGLIPKGGEYVEGSARVRGRSDSDRVVVFLVRTEGGRTGRAMVPYSDLRRSQRAFEDAEARKESGGVGGVITDEDAAEAVRQAEEDAESARAYADELEEKLKEAESRSQEPVRGYSDMNVDEIKEQVTVEEYGRSGVRAALEFEQAQDKPRKGVVEHLEKQLAGPSE